jgi:hypothetical protein
MATFIRVHFTTRTPAIGYAVGDARTAVRSELTTFRGSLQRCERCTDADDD